MALAAIELRRGIGLEARVDALATGRNSEPVRLRHSHLASPETIIDEARNGRMFILVDDEGRENEGDLVIPAQMATPEAINFMARHGRGLICLAMSRERIDQLGLPMMSRDNRSRHETAFTVSIEARDGVSTGISAADRARTIAVAIDASRGPEHVVTPGHVFPLVAKPGGVLMRAGHTEAAVDVARLAGLNPSGVICEVINDDGTMARMDDLITFAHTHHLKIGAIRDLIAYRRRYDHLIERRAEVRFHSRWGGEWTAIALHDKATGTEHLALVKGGIDVTKPTMVRMHTMSIFEDVFAEVSPRSGLLGRAMDEINEQGSGVVVVINKNGADALSRFLRTRSTGDGPSETYEDCDYGMGAQVLAELGIQNVVLLHSSYRTLAVLAGYGLNIVGSRTIP